VIPVIGYVDLRQIKTADTKQARTDKEMNGLTFCPVMSSAIIVWRDARRFDRGWGIGYS
jgi:hypothetical protein